MVGWGCEQGTKCWSSSQAVGYEELRRVMLSGEGMDEKLDEWSDVGSDLREEWASENGWDAVRCG